MDCPEISLLEQFALDALEDDEGSRVRAHLSSCASCQSQVEEVRENLAVEKRLVDACVDADGELVPELSVPSHIGGYRISHELGRGGMGVVYAAEQQEPTREVAIKVLRADHLVSSHRARLFRREIQALGRLKHAAIADIYEADRTESGEPYLVMELVYGRPLNVFLRETEASISARVVLIRKICSGINYAHQRGVIHRDLKPSNILVNADGNPKILDFGLARITDSDIAATTVETEVGRIQGTLQYMSPEQARGDPAAIDPRTDVYSLGVLLFQAVTAQLPYEINRNALVEATRVICETPPLRPGTINRAVRGDLETIILKALEKEPDRRYESAAALEEDLARYLTNEAIQARPASAVYQFRKLVSRHRMAFSFLIGLFVIVAGFGIAMSFLYADASRLRVIAEDKEQAAVKSRIAEQLAREDAENEADHARQIQVFLQEMISSVDPTVARGRDVTVLREVLDRAAARMDAALVNQPESEAEIRMTIGQTYTKLGLYDAADRHLSRALQIRTQLGGVDDEQTLAACIAVAQLRHDQGDWPEARALYESTLHSAENGHGEEHPVTQNARAGLGALLFHMKELDHAERLIRETLGIAEKMKDEEVTLYAMNDLAAVLKSKGEFEEAERLNRRVLAAHLESWGEKDPRTLETMHNLARLLESKGSLEDAAAMMERTLDLQKQVLGAEHPHVLSTMSSLAGLLPGLDRTEESIALLEQTLTVQERDLARGHPDTRVTMERLANHLAELDRFEEACQVQRKLLGLVEELLGGTHDETLLALTNLGFNLIETGLHAEAEAMLTRVWQTAKTSRPEGDLYTLVFRSNLGRGLAFMKQYDEAEVHLVASFDAISEMLGADHTVARQARDRVISLYQAWGKPGKAAAYRKANPSESP